MAVTEGLALNGVDLNDGVNFTLRGLAFPVPKKRQEWIQGADADGSALVRDPLFENRQIPVRVRVNPASSLTMDQALAKVGALVDQLEEAERQVDGLPLVWTPAQGTKSLTFYVISAQYDELPVEKSTQSSGWFLKAPMFSFVLDCKPFGYGAEVGTVLDDFSTDTIGAGNYSFSSGAGTIAVVGGRLVPSTTAIKLLTRAAAPSALYDAQVTLKVTTGAAPANTNEGVVVKFLDGNNYLLGALRSTSIAIIKSDGGVFTTLASFSYAALSASTAYWLRLRIEGNTLTIERWTAAPTATGTPATAFTYILGGADATKFGQGIAGAAGMRLQGSAAGTDYRYDDFRIEPNIWFGAGPVVTGTVPGIPGDVNAEGRVVVTDAAAQLRRHLECGLEQRYYSPGVPTVLDQFAADTIASGAWTVATGTAPTISGGQLVPGAASETKLYRSDADYADAVVTVKLTTGATPATTNDGVMLRWLSATQYLLLRVTSTTVSILKNDGGFTTLATSGAFAALAAATSYWLRATAQGRTLTVELFAADPKTGAATISGASVSYALTDDELATFAAGKAGLRIQGNGAGTDYRYDDFRICPLAGCTELLLDSESLITSGFGGAQATRAGAYGPGTVANHVVRGTLTTNAQAICGLSNLGHVGTFRVKVRVYAAIGTAVATDLKLRLSWKEGDGPLRSNDYATCQAGTAAFSEVDLGVVAIPEKTLGAQRWTGQIEAYSTTAGDVVDIDYVELIPTEIYGKARAPFVFETVTAFAARDEFDQVAGALAGKTAPVGGAWATVGVVTDFTVETTGHTATRATTGELTPGRLATVGAAMTDQLVQIDSKVTAGGIIGGAAYWGVLLRYIDAANYLIARVTPYTSTTSTIDLQKVVASVTTTIASISGVPFPTATYNTLRAVVTASGQVLIWYFAQGSPAGDVVLTGLDVALATGGALASGKPGFFDLNTAGAASTRNFDNFVAAVPTADAVIFPGLAAELRHDSAQRQSSTGSYYGPIASYRGGRVLVPPAGAAARALRVAAKGRRNDVDKMQDDQIADALWAQFKYTPRYLVIPR